MSLYDSFINFRNIFTGEHDNKTFPIEEVRKMAVNLTELINQVNRVSEVQAKAAAAIDNLVSEIKTISEQLAQKTQEAENTVDIQTINELIDKLKSSTNSLSNAMTTKESLL
jgi:ABC-type transporter Mla subunit MlaD